MSSTEIERRQTAGKITSRLQLCPVSRFNNNIYDLIAVKRKNILKRIERLLLVVFLQSHCATIHLWADGWRQQCQESEDTERSCRRNPLFFIFSRKLAYCHTIMLLYETAILAALFSSQNIPFCYPLSCPGTLLRPTSKAIASKSYRLC